MTRDRFDLRPIWPANPIDPTRTRPGLPVLPHLWIYTRMNKATIKLQLKYEQPTIKLIPTRTHWNWNPKIYSTYSNDYDSATTSIYSFFELEPSSIGLMQHLLERTRRVHLMELSLWAIEIPPLSLPRFVFPLLLSLNYRVRLGVGEACILCSLDGEGRHRWHI